ncbi:MAG: hypothetical protein P8L18_12670 [Verrucomicrobiota bacterium]|nr:hypothetical protein [Verrucomicrobiota bacterium]
MKNAYDALSVDLFSAAELEDVSESELQADPDGDGPDHLIVFIAVKNPRLLKSVTRILEITRMDVFSFELSVTSVPDRVGTLQILDRLEEVAWATLDARGALDSKPLFDMHGADGREKVSCLSCRVQVLVSARSITSARSPLQGLLLIIRMPDFLRCMQ